MRRPWLLLLLCACAGGPEADDDRGRSFHLRAAEEAAIEPDWPTVLRELERTDAERPDDPETLLRLANTHLEAFGRIERAESLYLRLRTHSMARALHGLGRCALWRGEEDRALELFERSLDERPTAPCARDLAVRLLGRGEPAAEALDRVEKISGNTLRSRLLLAAAGRRPPPARLPDGWSYGLERARLGDPGALEGYIEAAGATPHARSLLRKVLAGDPASGRNPHASAGVNR